MNGVPRCLFWTQSELVGKQLLITKQLLAHVPTADSESEDSLCLSGHPDIIVGRNTFLGRALEEDAGWRERGAEARRSDDADEGGLWGFLESLLEEKADCYGIGAGEVGNGK